jgi:hypothetical protein
MWYVMKDYLGMLDTLLGEVDLLVFVSENYYAKGYSYLGCYAMLYGKLLPVYKASRSRRQ